MVNTERWLRRYCRLLYYNILNIVVNTEHINVDNLWITHYNILNIVVNTEQGGVK